MIIAFLAAGTSTHATWIPETVDDSGAIADGTAIVTDMQSHVHIAYYDHGNNALNYVTNSTILCNQQNRKSFFAN